MMPETFVASSDIQNSAQLVYKQSSSQKLELQREEQTNQQEEPTNSKFLLESNQTVLVKSEIDERLPLKHPMLALSPEEDSDNLRLSECDNPSNGSDSVQLVCATRSCGSDSMILDESSDKDGSKSCCNSLSPGSISATAETQKEQADDISSISNAELKTNTKRSSSGSNSNSNQRTIQVRLLVRRREAGALIGKGGNNIRRLRETFRSSIFSVPDTGNGPERVVCLATDSESVDSILDDISQLLLEKSPENDNQIELKLLIHSSHAGSLIGIGGQSIKKLRNDSKAAIKIYEMCCPFSNERVCAIKAKPPIVVNTLRLIRNILDENPTKGTIKPYDALHFDLNLIDKYGGYLPEDALPLAAAYSSINSYDPHRQSAIIYNRPTAFYATSPSTINGKRYSVWRAPPKEEGSGIGTSEKLKSDPEKKPNEEKTPESVSGDELASKGNVSGHIDARSPSTPTNRLANNRFHPYQSASNETQYRRLRMVPQTARAIMYHHDHLRVPTEVRAGRLVPFPQRHLNPHLTQFPYALAPSDPCHQSSLAHGASCFCMFMPIIGADEFHSDPATIVGSTGVPPRPVSDLTTTPAATTNEAASFSSAQLPINKTSQQFSPSNFKTSQSGLVYRKR